MILSFYRYIFFIVIFTFVPELLKAGKDKTFPKRNILSQEKIVFELRQNQVTGKEIYDKSVLSLKNKKNISDRLTSLRKSLLVQDSSKFSRAIQEILS